MVRIHGAHVESCVSGLEHIALCDHLVLADAPEQASASDDLVSGIPEVFRVSAVQDELHKLPDYRKAAAFAII
jgi:hypothetical protein